MSTSGRDRRTPSRGARPAGRGSGPGRTSRPRRTTAAPARDRGRAGRAGTGVAPRPRPRLTSRAAILIVVLAVLAVSYSSLGRAYLVQREHLDDVQARIAASEAEIERLERERKRLDDPAYVETLARELGFVPVGEKPFVVLEDGEPLEVEAELSDPSTIDPAQPPAWWDDAWESVRIAGNPPRRTDPLPQTKITDPDGAPTEEDGE
jgi:cell division protein FtsB